MLDVIRARKPSTKLGKARIFAATGFSISRTIRGTEVNIFSANIARQLFLKRLQNRYRPLVGLMRNAIGRRVMIIADGLEWQKTHEALSPAFTPAQVTKTYAPVMRAVAREAIDDLAARCAGSAAKEVEVEPVMRAALARVMGFVLFGQVLTPNEGETVERWLDAATRDISGNSLSSINWTLSVVYALANRSERQPFVLPRVQRQAISSLLHWIEQKIAAARASGRSPPLLEALERRFDKANQTFNLRCVAAECAMLFIAGIETTASALTVAIAEIAGDPGLQCKVVLEARAGEGSGDNVIERFPLIYGVVMETLRRHTIVPTLLREAADDCVVTAKDKASGDASVAVRRGSILRYFTVQGHLRRSVWKNPYVFDPERFLGSLTREQAKTYNPFGMGPQTCTGRSMALIEATIVLAALFRRLDVEPKGITQPIRIKRNAVFTYRPVGVALRFMPVMAEDRKPE